MNIILLLIVNLSISAEMRCLRKAAGKTRMNTIRNEEIRRRVNMQSAGQTANKNKIRWWSHVKRMAPRAPGSKALVSKKTIKERPKIARKTIHTEIVQRDWVPMTEVNNWVTDVMYRAPMKNQCQLFGLTLGKQMQ